MTESSDLVVGVVGLIGGLLGVGGGSTLIYPLLKNVISSIIERHLKRFEELEKELKSLKENEFKALREEVKKHLDDDKSKVTTEILSRIEGALTKLTDTVNSFNRDLSRQDAEIKANEKYINNIDKSFQEHKRHHAA